MAGPTSGQRAARGKDSSSAQTLYQVLGVVDSATPAQVRAAHRSLVRKLHPDVNKAPDAHDAFTRVQRAYEVLIDSQKRASYDRLLTQRDAPTVEVVLSPHYAWSNVGAARSAKPGRSGAGAGGDVGVGVGVDGAARAAAEADLEREELSEDIDRFWRVLFEPRARERARRRGD